MGREWQKNIFVISASNQNKPFTELRNAIIYSIQNPIHSFIAELVEFREDNIQNRAQVLFRIIFVTLCKRSVL